MQWVFSTGSNKAMEYLRGRSLDIGSTTGAAALLGRGNGTQAKIVYTLSNWVGRACWWLSPLYDLVVSTVLSSGKVFADDTTLPVLDPGRGRTKTGRLWCYAVHDRPWCGPGHPAAAYVYEEHRKRVRPAAHLANVSGLLQVDGYAGFKRLAGDRADGSVSLAFCWAHARRKFYGLHQATGSPLAAEVLAQIR